MKKYELTFKLGEWSFLREGELLFWSSTSEDAIVNAEEFLKAEREPAELIIKWPGGKTERRAVSDQGETGLPS